MASFAVSEPGKSAEGDEEEEVDILS